MSDNRKIFKNSGILYIRLIIVTICGLFTSRLVLQSLGASDFGLYNVVGGIVVVIGLLNTAMISTSFRYIAFEMGKGNVQGVNQVFNISLVLHGCLALIVLLLAETVGIYYVHHFLNVPADRTADAVFVFRLSVLATVFSIVSAPYQGLITAQEHFTVRSSIEVVSGLLRLAIAISLLYYGADRLRLYAILTALVVAMTSILYMTYCRAKSAHIVRWHFVADKAKYKEMVDFGFWVLLGAAGCIGRVQGAALIINWFFGTLINAPFAVANQVNQVVLTFTQNLGQAAVPQITKSYSSGNSDRTMELVCYMNKYSFLLMLLPALPLLLETDFLLRLWLKAVPQYTALFCQLMVCNALIDCLMASFPSAVQATGKIRYFQIVQSVVSLSSLPVAFVLFKWYYQPYTILVVYIVTTIVNVAICLVLLRRLIRFDVKRFLNASYLRILYVVVCVSPLFAIKQLFDEGMSRSLFLLVLSVVWCVVAIYLVGIEERERAFFLSLLPGRTKPAA
jgi:O-antigen/teichoic acid export membrane protein